MRSGRVCAGILFCTMFMGSVLAAPGDTQWLPIAQGVASNLTEATCDNVRDAGLTVQVRAPGVLLTEVTGLAGEPFVQLSAPGCGATAATYGCPELPFKGFFLEIPYGVEVTADVQCGGEMSLGTGYRVWPQQRPMPESGDEVPPFEYDAEVYGTSEWLPAETVQIGEPGFIRGRRVVFVKVFPVQYNPATTELRALVDVRINVTFQGERDPAEAACKARLANQWSESIADAFVLNYEPAAVGGRAPGDPRTINGADYLIIVADNLIEEVQPLAAWKHRKGFITRVVRVSDIGNNTTAIKNYVQTAFNTWTPAPSYLLLVGDAADVAPGSYSGTLSCTTDNVYACVAGSDYYPDLTLGRLPVHTEAECTSVVTKLMQYDRTPVPGNWYEHFLAAAYFQDSGHNGVADRWFMETAMTTYQFMTQTQGFVGHTALTYDSSSQTVWHFRADSYPHREVVNLERWGVSPYPDPVPQWIVDLWATPAQATTQIASAINGGVTLVQHRDHGENTGWSDPPFHNADVDALTNGDMTPVVFSINCLTGSFHITTGDCFCERFIKKYPGGAVGIIGATRTSYSGHNDLLTHGMYTCFWPVYDTTHGDATYPRSKRPAEALDFGKFYMNIYEGGDSYSEGEFYMFHWFGDPEMNLRTLMPRQLAAAHPATAVYGGPVDIPVAVTMSGNPVAGARVSLSLPGGDDHWTGLTDAFGNYTFTGITLSQFADYDLVVTAQNGVPYEGIVSAVATSAGVVFLDRPAYACDDTAGVRISDLDLAGTGTHDVALSTSGGDSETLTLAEIGGATGLFGGTIALTGDPVVVGDGVLQVADGQVVTATYEDADDGTGQAVTVQTTANMDCVSPAVANVVVTGITYESATVSFTTDEPACARVLYGTSCGALTLQANGPCGETLHSFNLQNLLNGTPYYFVIEVEDAVGNVTVDDNGGACHTFTTEDLPDYFTENFSSSDNDLDNLALRFAPDGSSDFYHGCAEQLTELPTDPTGGTTLTLASNAFAEINFSRDVSLYGVTYNRCYVGSNGYITFSSGDTDSSESLTDHFEQPRISALFDNLNPSTGGTVSWRELDDRIVVTWLNVPQYSTSDSNTFQVEMHTDGTIVIAFLGIAATDGLTGLSAGFGTPGTFFEADLSNMGACGPRPPRAQNLAGQTPVNDPVLLTLPATDDGLPNPPAALTYIVTALPASGTLHDPGAGAITAVPYALVGFGNQIEYRPAPYFGGYDAFQFKVNDGGTPPDGGDSNIAVVTLMIGGAEPLYTYPLDSDPGWPCAGEWAFGQPTGQGGAAHGHPDPASGATGDNVYGVNLNGDYATQVGGPYDLTLGPVDLSHAVNCTLKYQRWLNTDYQSYVFATVEASNDGTNWTMIWENGTSPVVDNAWSLKEYDIAAVADHQPTVWIRWGYRIGSGAFAYSGWNIDDIEIWGLSELPPACAGDANCDGGISWRDIDYFVAAMNDNVAAWEAMFAPNQPVCPFVNNDVNGDGTVNWRDIDPLVGVMNTPCP